MTSENLTPFERECRRLMDARANATTTEERDDAEWALTYLFQMNGAGRLEEYLAAHREQAS